MTSAATTPEKYIREAPVERQEALKKLRETILKNLPKGFEEGMQYGMIGYYVPHSVYPAGYHCKPEEALLLKKTQLTFIILAFTLKKSCMIGL